MGKHKIINALGVTRLDKRQTGRELYARRTPGNAKKQRKFLGKMARQGWQLRAGTGGGSGYRFVRTLPAELDYYIDQRFVEESGMQSYVNRCAKHGWTFLYSVNGREHYFMGSKGTSLACFQKEDRDIPVILHGKTLAFAITLAALECLCAAAAIYFVRDTALWLALLAVCMIVVLWEMSRIMLFGYLRQKAKLRMVQTQVQKG